jgi:arylsulfatase
VPAVTAEVQRTLTTRYTERAVSFIERNKARPFFFYLAYAMPHVPLHVSPKFAGKSPRGIYGDVVMEIDWSVGQVMQALRDAGVDRDTLVVFASDNGPWLSYGDHAGTAEGLREGKGTCWEGGVRVPCVMRWPGKIPAGTTSDAMLMTIDLFPTLARLVDAPLPPRRIDGLDVWPLIAGTPGAKNPHDVYLYYYEQNQLQALVTGDGRWKLQLPHTYTTLAGKPAGRGGKPVKYEKATIKAPELYDLETDRAEAHDVASAHPEIVARLLAAAEAARVELGDALTKRTGRGFRPPDRVGP